MNAKDRDYDLLNLVESQNKAIDKLASIVQDLVAIIDSQGARITKLENSLSLVSSKLSMIQDPLR